MRGFRSRTRSPKSGIGGSAPARMMSARCFAMCALKAKGLNAAEAQAFGEIANQELGHADKLHSLAVACIDEAKRSRREAPAGMERVWEFEHGRMVKETAAVRSLLSSLSG